MSHEYSGPVALGSLVADKYEVIRLLGMGGMGAVYEARHRHTLKRCALKLLVTAELGHNPAIVQRFFREAQASSAFESDHVVVVYDSGVDSSSGYPFMVMELLSGEDLEGTIRRLGPLSPAAAVKLVMQAATGLARAHARGVVHRDIKPANLFLTQRESGEYLVKLLDFGIAKVKMESAAEVSPQLTRTGSILGTPLYMSPEQARSSASIDGRADVWSLGVVLYELLSGQPPHAEAGSLGELMVSIITSDAPPIRQVAPWVDEALAALVERALCRDLSRRYRDAAELLAALTQLMPEGSRLTPATLVAVSEAERGRVATRRTVLVSVGGTTPSNLAITRPLPGPTGSRRPLVVGAALAGALAVGIAVAWSRASAPTLSAAEGTAAAGAATLQPAVSLGPAPSATPTASALPPRATFGELSPAPSQVVVAKPAPRPKSVRRPAPSGQAAPETAASPAKPPTTTGKAAGVIGDASEFN